VCPLCSTLPHLVAQKFLQTHRTSSASALVFRVSLYIVSTRTNKLLVDERMDEINVFILAPFFFIIQSNCKL